jgi:hypothetical protein
MPGEYPHIEEALQGPVGDIIRRTWIFVAQPYSATGDYIRGLMASDSAEYPFSGDDLAVSIVNKSRHAMVVEVGHQGFHLPSQVQIWRHTNRRGRGYFVVPLRHFTPGFQSATGRAIRAAMPEEVYDQARQLGRERLRGLGDLYKQSKSYHYYRAIHPNFPSNLTARGYTWRSSKFEGMIRSEQRTPHANQGVYTTFRTVSQDSQGWYIPPMPGRYLAREAAERAGPLITPLIARAAQLDAVNAIASVFSGAGFRVEVS